MCAQGLHIMSSLYLQSVIFADIFITPPCPVTRLLIHIQCSTQIFKCMSSFHQCVFLLAHFWGLFVRRCIYEWFESLFAIQWTQKSKPLSNEQEWNKNEVISWKRERLYSSAECSHLNVLWLTARSCCFWVTLSACRHARNEELRIVFDATI